MIKIITVLFILALFITSWTIDSDVSYTANDDICFKRDALPAEM